MQVAVSHITGNANVKAAVNGFYFANMLASFNVSLATFDNNLLGKLATKSIFSELKRRRFINELEPLTQMWPWLEAGRVILPKLKMGALINNLNSPFHIDSVCKNFDRRVASGLEELSKKGVDAVYAYEDIAAYTFKKARQVEMTCLYDLPIGYWKAANDLMKSQQDTWPEYFETIIGFDQSEAKLQRKEEELQLADQIFVASTFTAKTLKYHQGSLAPVHVIPYGFPPVNLHDRQYVFNGNSKKLKLLFVGSLSQRKGIAEVFAAVERLKDHVTLTIVGTKAVESNTAVNNQLAKHTWIPSLAHDKILELMREHDVLLFPSLFEGFGLVITEAMSQGTPVITTDRTAGPDIIEHGTNGWIIQPSSTEALIETIENILLKPQLVSEVGIAAKKAAALRPWEQYGFELANAVSKLKDRKPISETIQSIAN